MVNNNLVCEAIKTTYGAGEFLSHPVSSARYVVVQNYKCGEAVVGVFDDPDILLRYISDNFGIHEVIHDEPGILILETRKGSSDGDGLVLQVMVHDEGKLQDCILP
jgi:hypothetical protein